MNWLWILLSVLRELFGFNFQFSSKEKFYSKPQIAYCKTRGMSEHLPQRIEDRTYKSFTVLLNLYLNSLIVVGVDPSCSRAILFLHYCNGLPFSVWCFSCLSSRSKVKMLLIVSFPPGVFHVLALLALKSTLTSGRSKVFTPNMLE